MRTRKDPDVDQVMRKKRKIPGGLKDGGMPQYDIGCVIGQKNQMSSDHPSSNARSKSSTCTTESDP